MNQQAPRSRKTLWLVVSGFAVLGTLFGLFYYFMQTSSRFAEAVARISPALANTFSCVTDCENAEDQQGLDRFKNGYPI
jgi:CHASE3 domain sensor protein